MISAYATLMDVRCRVSVTQVGGTVLLQCPRAAVSAHMSAGSAGRMKSLVASRREGLVPTIGGGEVRVGCVLGSTVIQADGAVLRLDGEATDALLAELEGAVAKAGGLAA